MKDISILICSNRNFESNAKKTIDSILNINTNYNYEILLYINQDIQYNGVRVIKDINGHGPPKSYNFLYKQSIGHYIFTLSDGVAVESNYFNIIEEINKHPVRIAGPSNGPKHKSAIRWPHLSRDTINRYLKGIIFNESFRYHCVDIWLCEYFRMFGYYLEETDKVKVYDHTWHPPRKNNDYYDELVLHNCRAKLQAFIQSKNQI